MFERFTRSAREAVVRATTEAKQLRQSPVGTEHLLLALLADPDWAPAATLRADGVDAAYVRAEILRRAGGIAGPGADAPDPEAEDAAALKAIGIDLDAVRRTIEETFGPGALRLPRETEPKRRGFMSRFYGSGHTPFSDRAKKVLELSLREAIRLKHNYIAREHLMLGLLRENHGLAARILTDAHVDAATLRAGLTESLKHRAA
ncbi:ClpA/ClpB-like protein [Krasilnikovia cinnamomea]|uniref:ClpA/ClpB-like protein n=1 Tax=Krasilnikovia cinnamomea TaxID=349313 RepID=A0A4Q7ZG99_9ACTN|nr:Clp protease N-terminal domain-containing protein [Krasilnikovia cinnamomea]RZU49049.1 ClpA/ClpB-like protein [Krasilnikovia cinnamomea]